MSLVKYKQKRNFASTPEPQSGKSTTPSKLAFVVQRHKASHLHYDFRLEIEGVLKSWAVPKGPSMNPGDKRLAMMVEDHPYDYKDFKGVIPEGYGAGIVEIWDKGTYNGVDEDSNKIDEKKMKASLKAGNLKFSLKGKKLNGEFALVRLKNAEKGNEWLLIKHRDDYAVDTSYDSEKETLKNSPINKWLAENKKEKKSVKKKS
ncbi:MAG: DNA polymerase ligase N-terminal domain-containing protein [Ferruginibacter sp.]